MPRQCWRVLNLKVRLKRLWPSRQRLAFGDYVATITGGQRAAAAALIASAIAWWASGLAGLQTCRWRGACSVFDFAIDGCAHLAGLAEMLAAVGKMSKPSTTAWLELVARMVMLPWLVRMV